MPVVIVTGSADRVVDPREHAYVLQQAIRNSKLIVLPETGHQLPQTRPDAVIAAIEAVWQESQAEVENKSSDGEFGSRFGCVLRSSG